jgi:hypothetical protein
VTGLFLEIDGKSVKPDYVQTGFFSLGAVTPGDIGYDLFGLRPQDVEQQPAKAAGYWALLEKLSIGTHTLHFGGSLDYQDAAGNFGHPDGVTDFSIDITDTIHVVPLDQYHPTVAPAAADLAWA